MPPRRIVRKVSSNAPIATPIFSAWAASGASKEEETAAAIRSFFMNVSE